MKPRIEWNDCPQWAKDEAAKRSGYGKYQPAASWFSEAFKHLACMIATHEDEPVDRALRIADRVFCETEQIYDENGHWQNFHEYGADCYNRGLEDAKPKWIEHTGGPCPVAPEVRVVMLDCENDGHVGEAQYGYWDDKEYPIKKYLVLEKSE